MCRAEHNLTPTTSGELVWCLFLHSFIQHSVRLQASLSHTSKDVQTHPSYPEHSSRSSNVGPQVRRRFQLWCSLGVCHLSVCWPVGHFLYEVTSSRKTSITQETLCNPAQETEWVHGSTHMQSPGPAFINVRVYKSWNNSVCVVNCKNTTSISQFAINHTHWWSNMEQLGFNFFYPLSIYLTIFHLTYYLQQNIYQ